MRVLDDLVRKGLVRYIGVSNWQAWKIVKALGISKANGYARFETVQAYYTVAGRDIERELVPMLTSEGLGLMVWSPLAGGLLSGKFGPGLPNPEDARRTHFDFPPVDRDRAWACITAMREIGEVHDASSRSTSVRAARVRHALTAKVDVLFLFLFRIRRDTLAPCPTATPMRSSA